MPSTAVTLLVREIVIDWVDPVIGLRGRMKIWKATKIFAEGDVGGFDANADTAFELRREGGPSGESRWIVLTGATSWRAGSNFNSRVRFGRRSGGVT